MRINSSMTASLLGLLGLLAIGAIPGALAQKAGKTVKVGSGLYEIVYSRQAKALYVAGAGRRGESGTAKIYKLDPATLEVKSTIDVSAAPAYGLGLNEKTQILYTSNTTSNSVHAIDLKTEKIVATITSGQERSHIRELVVDEEANKIYVSNLNSVWVIDGAANKFSHLIEETGAGTTGLALDRSNQRLFVTNMNADQIGVVDLKTNKVVNRFASGGKSPLNVYFDAGTDRLFVTNRGSGNVTVLDGSGKLLQTIPTGEGPLAVNFNRLRNLIYVTNRQSGTTTVIDAGTYKVVADLKTGTFPQTIAIDHESGRVFVTNKTTVRRPGTEPQTPLPEDPNGDVVTIIEP